MWIGGFEELHRGFAGFADFVAHTATDVENDADGDGDVFGRESYDLLFDVVFVDAEIVLFEAGDQAVVGVCNGDVYQSEVDVTADDFAGNNFDGGVSRLAS